MKLKYIAKISLVCGVMSTAVALSGCGSSKAVQANAAVVSRSSNASNSSEIESDSSSGVTVSSDLVSHSSPSVSSAVVTSSKPSTGSNSASHQAPATKSNSGGVTRTTSAAPRPASVAPRPASTTPTPRPTSTAPSAGVSAKYFGANYGCDSASEYSYVLQKANAVKGSSKYNSTYEAGKEYKDNFESLTGVSYSDTWNDILAIQSYFGTVGAGSASGGSAYDYYTGSNTVCSDTAKALEAALHVNGYNARLAAGGNHMWVQVNVGGTWYNLYKGAHSSVPAGLTLSRTGYNLG